MSFGTKVFSFDEVQFIFFLLVACAFGVIFKKPLPNKKSQRFTPMLSSKNFVILVTFRPLIHLSWILFVV